MLGWPLFAGVVNYLDRMGISIAAPSLIKEFGFTRTEIGLLGTVFSWAYALSQLPAGWLVDRFGARRLYSMAIAGWSVATMLMGLGSQLWQFLLFRTLLGIAEAPNGPASAKMTADWFPRNERGQASAIWDSGSKWGPAIAPPILTAILLHWGWRAIFYFLGFLGLALAGGMYVFYHHPKDHPRLSFAEGTLIQADKTAGLPPNVSWSQLFKFRQIWGMIAGYFCIIWVWNIFIVFLPLYLQEARGISVANSGLLAGVPYFGAAILGIFGGYVMTRHARRRMGSSLESKRRVMSACSVGAGVLICCIPFVISTVALIAVLTLSLGLVATMTAAAWAMPGDIVDDARVASVGAIQNFGGYFGGAFAPLLTGLLVDATGSYRLSFIIAGVIASLAAVIYTTLVRRPIASF
jgi:MFS family permease